MTLNDLRPELYAAYDQAAAVISAVSQEQLHRPTPCTKMDVSELVDHIVLAARRAAKLGRGETLAGESEAPHVDLREAPGVLRAAGAEAQAAWSDDASLGRVVTMPWGEEYPGRALVGIYLVELATHAWDLARATDNQQLLHDGLGEAALACARATIREDYRTEAGEPFGPEVPAPDDATVWERLGAFMGRDPR
ncbi:MAG TPA: TIGR03086 family metal-binding protein [Acidimicrobiales bacterium]|nr:TIGR03086 family metal-binding protein [Acidimicrobiales bacterium]